MINEVKDKYNSKAKLIDFDNYVDSLKIIVDGLVDNFKNNVNDSSEKIHDVFRKLEEIEQSYSENLELEINKRLIPTIGEKIGIDGLTDRQRSVIIMKERENEIKKYNINKKSELEKYNNKIDTVKQVVKYSLVTTCFLFMCKKIFK